MTTATASPNGNGNNGNLSYLNSMSGNGMVMSGNNGIGGFSTNGTSE